MFTQMKYFVSVVKNNSFTLAAEECFISQSAISQQISALEKELGVKLLYRKGRSFRLSAAGEYFFRQAQIILEEVEATRKETIHIGKDDESQLSIGYLKWYSSVELQNAVAEFSSIYPEITINVTQADYEELYQRLMSGRLDLVLSAQRRAFNRSYSNHHLVTANCFVEFSKQNELAEKEIVTLQEISKLPCIIVAAKKQQANEEDYYKNILGFKGNFLFAETIEEGRMMVLNNRGFLLIESLTSPHSQTAGVKQIPLYSSNRQLTRNYYAFWAKKSENYYIEEFVAILEKYLNY